MRQQSTSVDNTFVKGLITEATGLNYPPNACIEADNCVFSLIGDITRRPGLDAEDNFAYATATSSNVVYSSYKWNNAGGDGSTQILVQQIGSVLYFYLVSTATVASPLSTKRLLSAISLDAYIVTSSTANVECDFSDGNGYLFVYNANMTTLYCSYAAEVITATPIAIQIRDFNGISETAPVNYRPGTLSPQHLYNLNNQGWTQGSAWTSTDSTHAAFTSPPFVSPLSTGTQVFEIGAGLPITNGDNVQVYAPITDFQVYNPSLPIMTGSVTSYSGTTLTLNVYSVQSTVIVNVPGNITNPFVINPINLGYVNTWFSDIGNYPSNADVWWLFKNTSDVFDPGTTNVSITLNTGPAPKGHYILDAFNQQRDLTSGISGLTDVITTVRPKTGAWFQGRVWYAGPDASQAATGDQLHYSWSENIYFSQIIENVAQFGYCYSNNDPTSEDFADLLPSDGGVIRIQGCGSIYKLFPIQNGLLVFASNGIWFITGSQGIGFTANDYTVTKLSSVRALSKTSFIDVLGYPMFWTDEGIYSISPGQQSMLSVDNICLGSILSFYEDIPQISKVYSRGDFDPVNFTVTWLFRDIAEFNISDRYSFNKSLNFNISTKAFSPHTFGSTALIRDVKYIKGQGGSSFPQSVFKFFISTGLNHTFAELKDTTNWIDFVSIDSVGSNYVSTFTTGYKLKGGALRRWQPMYTYVFTDNNSVYKLQGIWDYATSGNAGRYSASQIFYNTDENSSVVFRRHKIRGHGLSLQYKYTSVDGEPFNFIGWSIIESSNASI